MRVVTNPGSNLDEDDAARLDVDLLPQKILVDGIPFDTRGTIDFAKVDAWVKRSTRHPAIQGTTEPEALEAFTRLAGADPELLCVMTSRTLIGSYDATVAAARTLKQSQQPAARTARVEIVDTGVTDVGAGLCTLAAVQARRAGLSLDAAAAFVRAFAARQRSAFLFATLEHLIKVGRASFLQGAVANLLNIRPLVAFEDGALTTAARVNAKSNFPERLDEHLAARLEPGTPVWLGVAHGNVPQQAEALAARLKERYRCEYALVRPLSTSIYVGAGPGSLLAFLYPLEGLPLRLTPPRA